MGKPIMIYVVAGVLIKKDGKYLLVQENQKKVRGVSVHGLWNFPAGKVEEGQTIEQAAVKEAKEETGFDVILTKEIGVFHEFPEPGCKHLFEAEIIGGELNFPKDEILDAKWFTLEEIKSMKDKLRGKWVLGAIEKVKK